MNTIDEPVLKEISKGLPASFEAVPEEEGWSKGGPCLVRLPKAASGTEWSGHPKPGSAPC
jgi:hypothetical protein